MASHIYLFHVICSSTFLTCLTFLQKMASQILALYNFDGGKAPCVGTVSAIIQPDLPSDYNKRIEKVCQLMTDKTPVIVR